MRPLRAAAPAVGLLLGGCFYLGSARPYNPETAEPGLDLLREIEPLRQRTENDCGPAALAMVLRYHKDTITLEEAIDAAPPREGGGVTAGALQGVARARGFRAHIVEGNLEDLVEQIGKDRPLIVGLIKPYIDKLRPHFEVVAGVHPEQKYVVTVDPARGWTRNSYEGFWMEWDAARVGKDRRPLIIIAPAAK